MLLVIRANSHGDVKTQSSTDLPVIRSFVKFTKVYIYLKSSCLFYAVSYHFHVWVSLRNNSWDLLSNHAASCTWRRCQYIYIKSHSDVCATSLICSQRNFIKPVNLSSQVLFCGTVHIILQIFLFTFGLRYAWVMAPVWPLLNDENRAASVFSLMNELQSRRI